MQMLMMRYQGRRIPKSRLFGPRNWRYTGLCVVREMQDIYTRRTMTIARFGELPDAEGGKLLYDARLVWFEPETKNFMLTGIERHRIGNDEVEFAQSWLVYIDKAPSEPEPVVETLPKDAEKMSERLLRRLGQIR